MQAFDSIAQKLLFETVREAEGSVDTIKTVHVLRNADLFPYYFTLVAVGGQFVALLVLLHDALPSGIASSIVGILSTILNIIYFVSFGYLINLDTFVVRQLALLQQGVHGEQSFIVLSEFPNLDLRTKKKYLLAVKCMLVGIIVMAFSWGLIHLLFWYYKPPTSQTRSLWRAIRESCLHNSINTPPCIVHSQSRVTCTQGEWLRLVCTTPVLILSAIGWCVCIVGWFIAGLPRYYYAEDIQPWSYTTALLQYNSGLRATFFVAPLLYLAIMMLLHTGCLGNTSTKSGVFAAILNTFLILNVGYTVVGVSIIKCSYDLYLSNPSSQFIFYTTSPEEYNYIINLILGGGIACLFFWIFIRAFWYFYCLIQGSRNPRHYTRLQSIIANSGHHPQTIFAHIQQSEYSSSLVPNKLAVPLPPHAMHLPGMEA